MSDETAAVRLLDEADACHDDEPERAAGLLRRVDPAAVPMDRLPGLAFLFNHVLGEKLGAWAEAHAMFAPLLQAGGEQPPPVLWRQAAAAAGLAGDDEAAERHVRTLAAATAADTEIARDVVALTQAMLQVPALSAADAATLVAAALAPLQQPRWQAAVTPLDGAAAACTNNMASSLIERPPQDLKDAALQAATEQTAALAEALWLRAGTWVNHERAAYLRALVANGLGGAAQARAHALRGLALLDANDGEGALVVDRAFILLEQARACRALGVAAEAAGALAAADAIAAGFAEEAGLADWYAGRRAAAAAG